LRTCDPLDGTILDELGRGGAKAKQNEKGNHRRPSRLNLSNLDKETNRPIIRAPRQNNDVLPMGVTALKTRERKTKMHVATRNREQLKKNFSPTAGQAGRGKRFFFSKDARSEKDKRPADERGIDVKQEKKQTGAGSKAA